MKKSLENFNTLDHANSKIKSIEKKLKVANKKRDANLNKIAFRDFFRDEDDIDGSKEKAEIQNSLQEIKKIDGEIFTLTDELSKYKMIKILAE
jgi:hypothetical protein